MVTFNIPDMSCGHCEKVITKAIKELDGNAKIHFDMAKKNVEVQSSANLQSLQTAIENTGYSINQVKNAGQKQESCCSHQGA